MKASISDCSSGDIPPDGEAEGLDADCVATIIGSKEEASDAGMPLCVSIAMTDELTTEASIADSSMDVEDRIEGSDNRVGDAVVCNA